MIANAERYGVPDTAMAAVINGFMYDIGRISQSDSSNIIDRNVVRTQRKLYREHNTPNITSLSGL